MTAMAVNRESLREVVREYIQRAAATAGLDLTNLARKAGLAPSTLNRFMNGKVSHVPGVPTLSAVAEASGVPVPADLLNPKALETRRTSSQSDNPLARPTRSRAPDDGDATAPRPPEFGPRDLPVLGRAQGGMGVVKIATDERPIDWVPRPRVLDNVSDAYALYVVDDSLAPIYEHGDLVYVHPGRPLAAGRVVVVQLDSDEAMIKLFVSQNDREVRLKQLAPPKTFTISKTEIRSIHRVIGGIDGR